MISEVIPTNLISAWDPLCSLSNSCKEIKCRRWRQIKNSIQMEH